MHDIHLIKNKDEQDDFKKKNYMNDTKEWSMQS